MNVRTLHRAWMLSCLAVALAAGTPARAQESEAPCAADAERLCPDAGPGRGEQMRCLRQNRDSLSETCRTSIVDPAARRAEAGDACGEDAVRLCPDAQPGRHGTGMLNCLRGHASELSEACRTALEALPGRNSMEPSPGV